MHFCIYTWLSQKHFEVIMAALQLNEIRCISVHPSTERQWQNLENLVSVFSPFSFLLKIFINLTFKIIFYALVVRFIFSITDLNFQLIMSNWLKKRLIPFEDIFDRFIIAKNEYLHVFIQHYSILLIIVLLLLFLR